MDQFVDDTLIREVSAGGTSLESKLIQSSYLIFVIFLHEQNFWRIKFTLKNANFSR